MYLPLLPLAALLTTVLADGAAIVDAISAISNSTIALNTTVANFPSSAILGVVDTVPLLLDSTNLLSTINSGTETAQSSANLTLLETLSVASATESLVSVVQSTLTTVINAKPKFDELLVVSPVLLLNLKLEKSASDKFSAAVISKVPAAFQSVAASLVAPIDTAFDNAIAVYE